MPHPHPHPNSTIKQQEQPNTPNNLQNDSSISMKDQGTDVHYYDLDYSDQHGDEDVASSSDDMGREISHEEFMRMISTDKERKSMKSQEVYWGKNRKGEQESYYEKDGSEYGHEPQQSSQQQQQETQLYYHQHRHPYKIHQQSHSHQQSHLIRSNDYKQHHVHPNKKSKYTPSTRDKSSNFYEYQHHKNVSRDKNSRNDPEKSSEVHKEKGRRRVNKSGETSSLFYGNGENSVNQFRIDSFLNAGQNQNQKREKGFKEQKGVKEQKRNERFQRQQKPWTQYGAQKREQPHHNQPQLDQSFSLITLPQYDNEESSQPSLQPNVLQLQNRLSRYKNIARLQQPHLQQQTTPYDKLTWRYQEAKLKFMDSFLPESMRIGNNGYNMLKYMSRKSQLVFGVLGVL